MAGSDVEIVVGAKDQATKILDSVGDQARTLGRRVKTMSKTATKDTRKVQTAFQSLKAAAGPLLVAFAAFKTATAGLRVIGDAAEAFDKQQEAVRGLGKAMELAGDQAGPTIEAHQKFASALQNAANVGDEVSLGLMKQASMLGVNNDELQDTTKAAIGLSEATGMSLEQSLRKVVEATNGSFSSLSRYIPAIRDAATEEEKLAILTETAGKGLEQKADRAGTAQGAAERLSNSWGDFLEVIGKALAPVRQFISMGLSTLVETIQVAVIPALDSFIPSAESIGEAMQKMKRWIITGITVAEVLITNFPKVVKRGFNKAKLFAIQLGANFRHAFTVVLPAHVKWFGKNFFTIMQDSFTAVLTMVQNQAKKIAGTMSRVGEFVKSGFEGGPSKLFADLGRIAGGSLLEGFEAKTAALPEIAGRVMTEGEKELMAKIAATADELSSEIESKLGKRLGKAGKDAGELMVAGLKGKAEGAEDDAAESLLDKVAKASGEGIDKIKKSSDKEISKVESRLLTRGSREDRMDKMVRFLASISRSNDRIEENTEPEEESAKREKESLQVEMVP